MIRAGITGGSERKAGELVRILINHPDIEIEWVQSKRLAGRAVTDYHHGLVGETDLRFQFSVSLDDVDVVFLCHPEGITGRWLVSRELPDDIMLIDLSPDMRAVNTFDFVYALPELNRKTLVRGAKRAAVPHPAAAAVELAMLPFAKAGVITGPVTADISYPDFCEPVDTVSVAAEVARAVSSFCETNVSVAVNAVADRVLSADVRIPTSADIGEIYRLFEEFYDDHNFVFAVTNRPESKEVEGTNKCLVYIDKAEGIADVHIIFDAAIKGEAGQAVHILNLLFGLAERTGLALKASTLA